MKLNNHLKKLKCPHCKNDYLYIKIDFVKRKGFGKCIKKVVKSSYIIRKTKKNKIIGCGKQFKIVFTEKLNGKNYRH